MQRLRVGMQGLVGTLTFLAEQMLVVPQDSLVFPVTPALGAMGACSSLCRAEVADALL